MDMQEQWYQVISQKIIETFSDSEEQRKCLDFFLKFIERKPIDMDKEAQKEAVDLLARAIKKQIDENN